MCLSFADGKPYRGQGKEMDVLAVQPTPVVWKPHPSSS